MQELQDAIQFWAGNAYVDACTQRIPGAPRQPVRRFGGRANTSRCTYAGGACHDRQLPPRLHVASGRRIGDGRLPHGAALYKRRMMCAGVSSGLPEAREPY